LKELIAVKAIVQNFVNTEKTRWKKAIRSAMRDVATKVEADFMAQAKECMDAYYREYDPLEYERTFNLQDNGYHPYRRYRRNEIDVGVAFSADEMNPYSVEDNSGLSGYDIANIVVNNFMQGIHGRPSIAVGRHVDETMSHFTTAYKHWELDKYFQNNFIQYMK
jgi:hypothetical protein